MACKDNAVNEKFFYHHSLPYVVPVYIQCECADIA